MTLKISGSFLGVADPGARIKRDIQVVTMHIEYTLHTSEMSGSEAVTRSVLMLLILVPTFCRCSVHTFLHSWIDKSSVAASAAVIGMQTSPQNGNSLTGSIVHSPTNETFLS